MTVMSKCMAPKQFHSLAKTYVDVHNVKKCRSKTSSSWKKNDPGHCRSNCQPRVRREFRNVPFLPDNVYYKIKKLSKLTGLPKIVCFPDFHLNPSPVI